MYYSSVRSAGWDSGGVGYILSTLDDNLWGFRPTQCVEIRLILCPWWYVARAAFYCPSKQQWKKKKTRIKIRIYTSLFTYHFVIRIAIRWQKGGKTTSFQRNCFRTSIKQFSRAVRIEAHAYFIILNFHLENYFFFRWRIVTNKASSIRKKFLVENNENDRSERNRIWQHVMEELL